MSRESEVAVGLATMALVWGVYSRTCPPMVDLRVGEPNDPHVSSSERTARWTSAAIVSGIALITKSPTVFILGGLATIALSWQTRHANAVDPMTNGPVSPIANPSPLSDSRPR